MYVLNLSLQLLSNCQSSSCPLSIAVALLLHLHAFFSTDSHNGSDTIDMLCYTMHVYEYCESSIPGRYIVYKSL